MDDGGLGNCLVVVEQRPDAPGRHDFVVARSGSDHRPHLCVGGDDEVDHDRLVVDGLRLTDRSLDIFFTLDTNSVAAQCFCELHEVRDADGAVRSEVGVGVALFVEECLPLTHHAEVAVVDEGNLDRDTFEGTGCEFLIGHLEAAVASIAHTSVSGMPILAPMAAGTAYPMVPSPPELSHVRGFS